MNTEIEEATIDMLDVAKVTHNTPALQSSRELASAPAGPMSGALAFLQGGGDPATLEKMMDLQERFDAKQSEKAFNEAMVATQAKMGRVSADAVNPQTRSQYASYAQLDRHLRPIYTSNGFSLSFDEGEGAPENYVRVLCYVSHIAGHARTYRCDIPADGKGAKGGDVMTKTHAVGSGKSYGKRYLLKDIFNVAVGEDDDDGNGAGQELRQTWVVKATKAQSAKELQEIRRDGTAAFQKAKDRDGYAEFAAAVKGRAGQLEQAA